MTCRLVICLSHVYVCFMQTATAETGANVRAEIARRGVTQAAISEAIGVSQSQFSKRLQGRIAFDINELASIAHVLDVPLTDLIPREKAGSQPA